MNETNEDVGDDVAGAGIEIGPIGLIGHILLCPQLSNKQRFLAVFVPEWMASHAHEVAVVLQQFFEAGAGDVGEFEFGFLGRAAGLTALEDVSSELSAFIIQPRKSIANAKRLRYPRDEISMISQTPKYRET